MDFIYAPPAQEPRWGRTKYAPFTGDPQPTRHPADKPVFKADPLNLFVVVETGDHHVTLLDGDRFEPIFRFPSDYALHGGPKFSPDGRFVYFGSRDGWVSNTTSTTQGHGRDPRRHQHAQHGRLERRPLGDGGQLSAAHAGGVRGGRPLPGQAHPGGGRDGKSSRVSAVYDAAPRESFIVALKDIPEVWEIPYGDKAQPIYGGWCTTTDGRGSRGKGAVPHAAHRLDDYPRRFFLRSAMKI